MRIVLALAVFTASISSIAIAEARVGLICTKSSQQTSGLTKICYYNCAGTERCHDGTNLRALPALDPRTGG
jgi:hypothetical protein